MHIGRAVSCTGLRPDKGFQEVALLYGSQTMWLASGSAVKRDYTRALQGSSWCSDAHCHSEARQSLQAAAGNTRAQHCKPRSTLDRDIDSAHIAPRQPSKRSDPASLSCGRIGHTLVLFIEGLVDSTMNIGLYRSQSRIR